MKLDKQTLQYLLILVLLVIGINFLLNNLHVIPQTLGFIFSLLIPFVIGSVIAFIVNVPMKKIEKYLEKETKLKPKNRRMIALFLAIFLVLGVVVFVIFLVVPAFFKALVDVINALPGMLTSVTTELREWFDSSPQVLDQISTVEKSMEDILGTFMSSISSSAGDIAGRVFSFLTSTISTLFNIVVGFVFAIYVLLAKEGLKRQYQKILFAVLPAEKANYVLDFGTLTNHIFSNFLTGQFAEAFINGALYFVGSLIFQFPYGVVISVLMGFCALIPYFGAFIGSFIGAILIASQSVSAAFFFLIFCLVIQQIDGNIIYPRVVGDQIGLPAIWVLVAVTIGASLWGLTGMVVMVPFASVVYSLVTMWINRRLENKRINIDEMEPRKLGKLFPKKDGSQDDHTI